ncbi:MAG: PLP-dependent aminotransferase family protein [Acidobacteriaceae bacterium]
MIDFQFNYPILDDQRDQFIRLIHESLRQPDLLELPPDAGRDEHRQAGAEWLSRTGYAITKDRVVLCCGGHHAVMVTLLALEMGGKQIVVDPLTYSNFKTQAASLGIELLPCKGDAGGMLPDALATLARTHRPAAVYLMPTVHNPLGTVMPEDRRREICDVADRHGLTILDDDAYAFLEADPPPSFAALAPDRAFSVSSFSKPFAPAMKLAFLAFPESYADQLISIIKVTTSGTSAILAEVAARLIRSGDMASLLAAKRAEAAERQKIARAVLEGISVRAHPTAFHLWIDLPRHQPAAGLAERLEQDGILVSSSDNFRATPEVEASGIRIAMGTVRSHAVLQEGLEIVRRHLRP